MGQVLTAINYATTGTSDAIPALNMHGTLFLWTPLDDGVMGGNSRSSLSKDEDEKTLKFHGTIDQSASVGWASVRASLPPGTFTDTTNALRISFCGDGKTYKLLLMDANHERKLGQSPLWETDLPTTASVKETRDIPLQKFTPSYMAKQLTDSQTKRHPFHPSQMTKIGFMLSSRLSDGSKNTTYKDEGRTFAFQLDVESLETLDQESKQ